MSGAGAGSLARPHAVSPPGRCRDRPASSTPPPPSRESHESSVESKLRARGLLHPHKSLQAAWTAHEIQLQNVLTNRLSQSTAPQLAFFHELIQADCMLLSQLQHGCGAASRSRPEELWKDRRFVKKPSPMLGRVLELLSRFTAESFRDEWMLACELSLSLVICINTQSFLIIASERVDWLRWLNQATKHAEMAVGTNLHGVRNACVYTLSCAHTLISAQSSDASVDYAQLSLQCLQTMVATAANHLHVGGLIGVESKASALSAQLAQWLLAEAKRKYYKHTAGPLLLMWPHAHAHPSLECVRAFQSQFGEIMTQTRGVFWQRQVTYLGVLHAQLQQILARSEATTAERHSPLYSSDELLLLCDALLFGGRTSALPGLVHGHEFKATFLRGDWRVREKCVTAIVDLLITCKRQLNERTADLAAARCMHDLLVLMFVHRCILEDVRQVRETLEWALREHLPDLWDKRTRKVLRGDAFKEQLKEVLGERFKQAQKMSKQRGQHSARDTAAATASSPGSPPAPAPPGRCPSLAQEKRVKIRVLSMGITMDLLRLRRPSEGKPNRREHKWQMTCDLAALLPEAPTTAEFAVALEEQQRVLEPLLDIPAEHRTSAQADAREQLRETKTHLHQLKDASPLVEMEIRAVREEMGHEPLEDDDNDDEPAQAAASAIERDAHVRSRSEPVQPSAAASAAASSPSAPRVRVDPLAAGDLGADREPAVDLTRTVPRIASPFDVTVRRLQAEQ